MAPVLLPIRIEPLQAQGQHSGGQIGITLSVGQNQKSAVVDDKAQAPSALTRRPADFLLPGFGMRSGPTEGEQPHPLPIDFSHIAKALSPQPRTVQIVLFLQELIETILLCRSYETHSQFAEELWFGRSFLLCHCPWLAKSKNRCLAIS